eukprot:TRINITY_DN4603_c0_g1_i1.p1 TRINITY_DN4603_c0_g1~~TRINITY_DN4603_c0_g1_i1.p1  ORF type:complete len:397 (-),score=100.17 TRINITY_DN4603_c0_g1_i1:61-1218(-)
MEAEATPAAPTAAAPPELTAAAPTAPTTVVAAAAEIARVAPPQQQAAAAVGETPQAAAEAAAENAAAEVVAPAAADAESTPVATKPPAPAAAAAPAQAAASSTPAAAAPVTAEAPAPTAAAATATQEPAAPASAALAPASVSALAGTVAQAAEAPGSAQARGQDDSIAIPVRLSVALQGNVTEHGKHGTEEINLQVKPGVTIGDVVTQVQKKVEALIGAEAPLIGLMMDKGVPVSLGTDMADLREVVVEVLTHAEYSQSVGTRKDLESVQGLDPPPLLQTEDASAPPQKRQRKMSDNGTDGSPSDKKASAAPGATLPLDSLSTATDMSCHQCKNRHGRCYLCPVNNNHRYCDKCLNRHGYVFTRDGCAVCCHACTCAACKRKFPK